MDLILFFHVLNKFFPRIVC